MLVFDNYHKVHYEAIKAEKELGQPMEYMGKDTTQKIYLFSNGLGASVVNGTVSFGQDELAVLIFENPVKLCRSKKKRFKKKMLKRAGQYDLNYSTPVTDGVKRYASEKDLQRDLNIIANLKG